MIQLFKRITAGLLSGVCWASCMSVMPVTAAENAFPNRTLEISIVGEDGITLLEEPMLSVSVDAYPVYENAEDIDSWDVEDNPIYSDMIWNGNLGPLYVENIHAGWEYDINLTDDKPYEPENAYDKKEWSILVQDAALKDDQGHDLSYLLSWEKEYQPQASQYVTFYPGTECGEHLYLTIQLWEFPYDRLEKFPSQGACGENLQWSFNRNGTLTISGTGDMWDSDRYGYYYSGRKLWENFQDEIQNIIIEEGCTSIGAYSFLNYYYLRSIRFPSTLKKIGASAFEGCDMIYDLVLPESLETIGDKAFSNYNADNPQQSTGVFRTLTINEKCKTIGDYAFAGNVHLKELVIPDSVESIGEGAFCECQILRKVKLSEKMTEIPAYAFQGCELLESVTFNSSLCSIGDYAFQECMYLKDLTLPDGIQSIGYFAFSYCEYLNSIRIGDGISVLECCCFRDCPNLTTVIVGDGLQSIDAYCFTGCKALTKLEAPDSLVHIDERAFYGVNPDFLKSFPNGLVIIGSTLYRSLNTSEEIEIPEGVRSISSHAFCQTDEKDDDGVITVEIVPNKTARIVHLPKSLEILDNQAFSEMYAVTDLIFENQSIDINYLSFENCSWLWNSPDDFVIVGTTLVGYHGKETLITIPEGITQICGKFANTVELSTVTCPSTLKKIDDHAFDGQAKLFEVTLNDGLEYIGKYAFSGTKRLTELKMPDSLIEIDEEAAARSDTAVFASGLTTVYGSEYSEAEFFAEKNRLKFITTDEVEQHGISKKLILGKDTFCFGNSPAYLGDVQLSDAQIQRIKENMAKNRDLDLDAPWEGSCYGFSVVTVLVKSGVLLPQDLDENAKTLHDVQPTAKVASIINYYQNTIDLQGIYDARLKYSKMDQDKQKLYQLIRTAKAVENGSNPFVLSLAWDNGTRICAHAVVGYGLESGSWEIDGKTYDNRILIWDCNYVNDTDNHSALYYQSSTLDWCVPAYGIHVNHDYQTDNGELTFVCNSTDILNMYPCPELPTREPTPSQMTLRGDVTLDDEVSIDDVIMLARYTAEDTGVSIAPQGLLNADVNYDRRYTAQDVQIILRIIAKLEN